MSWVFALFDQLYTAELQGEKSLMAAIAECKTSQDGVSLLVRRYMCNLAGVYTYVYSSICHGTLAASFVAEC